MWIVAWTGWPFCSASRTSQLAIGILLYVGLHNYVVKLSVQRELAFYSFPTCVWHKLQQLHLQDLQASSFPSPEQWPETSSQWVRAQLSSPLHYKKLPVQPQCCFQTAWCCSHGYDGRLLVDWTSWQWWQIGFAPCSQFSSYMQCADNDAIVKIVLTFLQHGGAK